MYINKLNIENGLMCFVLKRSNWIGTAKIVKANEKAGVYIDNRPRLASDNGPGDSAMILTKDIHRPDKRITFNRCKNTINSPHFSIY